MVSAIEIVFLRGGRHGTAGTAKDDGVTYYNWSQIANISSNSPIHNLMKNQLK